MDDDLDELFGDQDDIEIVQERNVEEPSEDNAQVNENESSKENKRIVKPKKVVSRPQPKLDATRLLGPRGIGVLESTCKEIKLKGKGHEAEDLDTVLRSLQHWAHRLFPKMPFDECLDKIEDLGAKRNVMTVITKIRLGMEDTLTEIVPEETPPVVHDPFDDLLNDKPKEPTLTEEQRARMMRNRLIAEERRMERMKAAMEKRNNIAKEQQSLQDGVDK